MNYTLLLLVILLEGFVTIAVEILTLRQVIPVAGNSIVVTSLVIGVFLLFLAYGYRKGGLYKENYQHILKSNFCWAAVGVGIGLSYAFIELFFHVCHLLGLNALITLLGYLLIVIAPIVYLLGQTVPITTNLFRQEHHIGTISGKVLHLSTVGSFLGAVLTSLLLMNYLGVAWTIFINYCVLSFLALILIPQLHLEWLRLVVLLCVGSVIYAININTEKAIFLATTPYANYYLRPNFVYQNQKGTLLAINNSASSFITPEKKAFAYVERIKSLLFDELKLRNKTILVLGAGGFTLSAERDNDNRFIYVDIDNQIEKLVKKHFLSKIKGRFIVADAREYLRKNPQKYDVIISDVCSNYYIIPAQLLTKEHFTHIKNALAKDGIVIFNMLARPTLDDAYSKHIDNTLRSVFASCMVIPEKYQGELTNILYVCRPSAYENDLMIYTDDKNRSTLDSVS
jgi:predicted membrane-bound spermidine synthase